MIEKIYNCSKCRQFSKSIAGDSHEEIFSMAIEKILVNKINIEEENYTTWFYTILKSCYLDTIKSKYNQCVDLNEMIEEEQEQESNYKIALQRFLNKDFKNDELKFYQDLIYLSMENTKYSLCNKLNLRRADLNKYLEQAKQLIRNEYNTIVNN